MAYTHENTIKALKVQLKLNPTKNFKYKNHTTFKFKSNSLFFSQKRGTSHLLPYLNKV